MFKIVPPSPSAMLRPDEGGQAERSLEVDTDDLVEEGFLDGVDAGYSGDRPALLTSTSTRPKCS
jgi:hypothetical protein